MPTGVPRKIVGSELKPLLPKNWKVIDSARPFSNLQVPIVQIKQRRLERNTIAPVKVWDCELIVTVWAPQSNTEAAEDALDDTLLPTLIAALENIDGVLWEEAVKVKSEDESRLGYDIRITIPLVKE